MNRLSEATSTRTLPPDAVDVAVVGNDALLVTFSNGENRLFDIKPLLPRKCYAKLNNRAFLAKAFIQYGCLTWPDNIDIDPDWLYEDMFPNINEMKEEFY